MKIFLQTKQIVESELKILFCELIKDDSFKNILKYGLKKQMNAIDLSVLLIDYIKNNYQREL